MIRDEKFYQEIGTITVETRNTGSKSEHQGFVFRPEHSKSQWWELRSETELLYPDIKNDELAELVGKKVNLVAKRIGGKILLVELVTVA
ncbi:MAG: hypothetical protein HY225_03450 [Candidatus Vogelbacteria bacterium]|nr:hypothetical protein [Candidatus Vogelbacteria bacterium]